MRAVHSGIDFHLNKHQLVLIGILIFCDTHTIYMYMYVCIYITIYRRNIDRRKKSQKNWRKTLGIEIAREKS